MNYGGDGIYIEGDFDLNTLINKELSKFLAVNPSYVDYKEDLIQEVWVSILELRERRPGIVDGKFYRMEIRWGILRGAKSRYRRYHWRDKEEIELLQDFVFEHLPDEAKPIERYEAAQAIHMVNKAIEKEGPRAQEIWSLSSQGIDGSAIGRKLGLSRERIRQLLNEYREIAQQTIYAPGDVYEVAA